MRLQLHALAYDLANFLRTVALPDEVKQWLLTTLRNRQVRICARIVRHGQLGDLPDGRGRGAARTIPGKSSAPSRRSGRCRRFDVEHLLLRDPVQSTAGEVRPDADLPVQLPALAALIGRPAALCWVRERSGRCWTRGWEHMLPPWRAKEPLHWGNPGSCRILKTPLFRLSPNIASRAIAEACMSATFRAAEPAFVLLHGFPDNSHIYDDLIPHLVSAGRRTVAIDFLGFGASDKPEDAPYSFARQLGDLEAVVEALGSIRSSPSATTPAARPPSISL